MLSALSDFTSVGNHLDGISNYFRNRTTSGAMEGINNHIKLIKREGYGFVSFNNFREGWLACFSKYEAKRSASVVHEKSLSLSLDRISRVLLSVVMNCPHPQSFSLGRRELRVLFPLLWEGARVRAASEGRRG